MATTNIADVKLDVESVARLKRLAKTRRRSFQRLVREAIEQYVEREERRAEFYRDALAAWDAFQTDHLHLTAVEADQWLAKLEAGEDAEIPQCHN